MLGIFDKREWMLGKSEMRGFPRPMRDGWQVCCSHLRLVRIHIPALPLLPIDITPISVCTHHYSIMCLVFSSCVWA